MRQRRTEIDVEARGWATKNFWGITPITRRSMTGYEFSRLLEVY
jgi:hypothetical protein